MRAQFITRVVDGRHLSIFYADQPADPFLDPMMSPVKGMIGLMQCAHFCKHLGYEQCCLCRQKTQPEHKTVLCKICRIAFPK